MQKEINEFIIPNVEIDASKRAVIVHKDYALSEALLKEPLRNKYSIHTLDVKSFVNLVNEYKEENSKLFFDDKTIECIVDFNTKEKAEFKDKRITLGLGVTPFYYAFNQTIDKNLSQRDFVFFLKSLFSFVKEIDGKPNDNMDVIELAESLQAVKKFDSVQKNTSSKISLDVEIKSGAKESLTLPNKLTFELPIYEADTTILGKFETELFVNIDEEKFNLKLVCYTAEIVRRDALDRLMQSISAKCEDVKAYKASI